MRRVLVVDDEPLTLEVAKMALELAGWTVTTATNGAEVLERACVEQPDAILMDVMMPGMDGPTACRRLAEAPTTAHIPVILFTAKVQHAEQRRWASLPVVGVLTKPFDPMRLAADVRTLLGWPEDVRDER